ncbi:MAG: hypothetical protein HC901_00010 [Bdellovibrionaceae bacterium]|nr:hypothetical protein [Pseudobdellovibrionaceae bacterium]
MSIHQTKHLFDLGVTIAEGGSGEKPPHEIIQGALLPTRIVPTGLKKLFIHGKSYVLHLHILCVHGICVKKLMASTDPARIRLRLYILGEQVTSCGISDQIDSPSRTQ